VSAGGHPMFMQQVTLVPGCVQEHSLLVNTEVKIKITFHNLELLLLSVLYALKDQEIEPTDLRKHKVYDVSVRHSNFLWLVHKIVCVCVCVQ
jgi:hypothetical protein